MYAIDAMGLKVCIRQGTQIAIHPDQVKQWSNAGEDISQQFTVLKEEHDKKYLMLLADQISSQSRRPGTLVKTEEANTEATPLPGLDESKDDQPLEKPKVFASEEKLIESDPIETRCASEVAGIELLRGKSGKIYLLAEKDKVLPKWSLLGGYGTGKQLVYLGFQSRNCQMFLLMSSPSFTKS